MLLVTEGITEEHLSDVYSDPYILRVGHDHRPASPVIHPLVTYLTATIHGVFAGAFLAIRHSFVEIELHALLKRHALPSSRKLGRLAIDWAFSHSGVLRITSHVISGLESAKNYCLKLGYRHEGTRRNACVVNGKVRDVYLMGLLRQEWKA